MQTKGEKGETARLEGVTKTLLKQKTIANERQVFVFGYFRRFCNANLTMAGVLSSARIVCTTSHATGHEAEKVSPTSSNSAFWLSSGLFPQDLIISFSKSEEIRQVEIMSSHICKLELARYENGGSSSSSSVPVSLLHASEELWTATCEATCDNADGQLQRLTLPITNKFSALHLRLRIVSGYNDFVAVFQINVVGASGAGGRK